MLHIHWPTLHCFNGKLVIIIDLRYVSSALVCMFVSSVVSQVLFLLDPLLLHGFCFCSNVKKLEET